MEIENEVKKVTKKKLRFKIDFKSLLKKPLFYLTIFLILSSLFLIFSIIKIGVLGLKFLVPIILGIILIDFLLLFFLNRVKKKKAKVFLSICEVIITLIYLIVSIVLMQFYSSMNNMFKNNSYIDYSVLTIKKSEYKKIGDINDKIIGYYVDDKYNEMAQKTLKKKIEAKYVGYSSINELKNALLTKEVDAMLIMDSYLELSENEEESELGEVVDDNTHKISEEDQKILDNIDNFDNKSKTIYKFKVKVDNSNKSKKINLEKGSFAVYVSGQDSYANSVSETSRSDVNMLMVVNLKSKQILLLSIPRDYYINISSKGAYDKLTHISLYGSEEAMSSLGDLLDVDVDYFVKFNFTTFMKAVEYLLPLDVYSDYDFTTSVYDQTIGNSYTFSKGFNHITDGKMALQFVRARKNFAEGDRQRGINQSRFLRAVINKASTPSILLKYNKILKALEGTFLTNISDESIREIAKYVLNNNGSFNISSISLNGSDASRPTYSGGSQALYVMIPDATTIESAKTQIKTVLDGGKPDIEKDASELADVRETHNVTSKDIGKTYFYTGGSSKQPINNTPVVVPPSAVPENPKDDEKDDKDPDDNEEKPVNPGEEEQPDPKPSEQPNPSGPEESPKPDEGENGSNS